MGFLVRPFGALFFGRLGDLLGRRIAFIFTLTIMGFSTASIGLLPTYHSAGWFSPIILIAIRMLQGLALGGEYGGAAVFVAEHVPDNKRGFYTSFIQITATLGLFVSLAVIVATQQSMSPATFQDWGWRLPFLLKAAGMSSTKPLTDAFTKWANLKLVLISLFGATAGQGVVWYTGQFYALFYLQTVLKLNAKTANIDVAVALLAAMPFWRQQLYPTGGFSAIPGYWSQTAKWLDAHQGDQTTLLVPGAPTAWYTWGKPADEPLATLAPERVRPPANVLADLMAAHS